MKPQSVQFLVTQEQKRYVKLRGLGNASRGFRYLIDACMDSDTIVVSKEEWEKLAEDSARLRRVAEAMEGKP